MATKVLVRIVLGYLIEKKDTAVCSFDCTSQHSYYTPAKRSFMGYAVYSKSRILSFRPSVIPSFRQQLRFCSITLIAFVRFCLNLRHTLTIRQCTFERKIGARGSVLHELCLFVILLIKCIITGSTPFLNRFLLYNFDSFCLILFNIKPQLTHQTMHVC